MTYRLPIEYSAELFQIKNFLEELSAHQEHRLVNCSSHWELEIACVDCDRDIKTSYREFKDSSNLQVNQLYFDLKDLYSVNMCDIKDKVNKILNKNTNILSKIDKIKSFI